MLHYGQALAARPWLVVLFLSATTLAAINRTEHISGIAHAAVRVSDLQATLRFYQLLGFERSFEFTKNGVPTEEFLKVNDRQFIELYPNKPGEQLGLMHVCFESDDLAALRQDYVEAGLNPPEIKRGGAGNDLFSLHRPDGAVIEFTQYQPGSLHSKDQGLHLGASRISDRLAEVIEPVADGASAIAFYEQRLGFSAEGEARKFELRVPSREVTRLGFEAAGRRMRFVFAVGSVERARRELGKRGIHFAHVDHGVLTEDPDGNELLFIDQR
jgi:catechol 2,3-dioxygenase-like lactoylglutathione lyase family enzyme/predicted enzyme related to lactoylglutathione lyase